MGVSALGTLYGGAVMRALVSIHDVFPATLGRVERIVEDLLAREHRRIMLLVVPGHHWDAPGIRRLAAWQEAGIELAAHGWSHRVDCVRGPYHRLHAALISRDAAEHLALDADGIAALMQRSHDWFVARGLDAPATYVPPAWALGAIDRDRLRQLPYRQIEVARGLLSTASQRLRPLPLAGFEADTVARATFLRGWNRIQVRLARLSDRPLRIGIHPHDPELRLASDLYRLLDQPMRSESYIA